MDTLKVAVLTCSSLGYQTADAISSLPEVSSVTVVESPPIRSRSMWRRLRLTYRRFGIVGTFLRVVKKVSQRNTRASVPEGNPKHHFVVSSFHSEEGLRVLEDLAPDLMVVDGTYILQESVFSIPHLGTVNLHCGYLPDYRGSPPVFWELFEGEDTVGVSIHMVTADLDGGPILARRRFPIDPAPPTDPLEYCSTIWREVLRPAGIEMICNAIRSAAAGTLRAEPQPKDEGTTYRSPDFRQKKELRRRVAARRRQLG